MKIAFFTDTYLPNKDGVVTSILSMCEFLEGKKNKVYVFSSGSECDRIENRDRNVFYYTSAKFAPYPDYKVALFPFFAPLKARKLGIGLVHSHAVATMGLAAVQTSKFLRVPSVATFHTLVTGATHYLGWGETAQGVGGRLIWKYLQAYYNCFDEVTCPSESTRRILAEHGIESVIVPSGVDVEKFSHSKKEGEAVKKRLGISGKRVILYLGRVAKEKSLDVLIEAAGIIRSELPDSVFVVAGRGPALEYYEGIVKKSNLEGMFLFTGFVPEGELRSFYCAADVFVLPSLFETQGMTALEALSCGVPVCAPKKSATAEFISEGKSGYCFHDGEDCAEKILMAIEDGGRMGKFARKSALAYSKEKCAEKMLKVYEGLLK
ncbi:hypothetical protein AUJ17_01345 [Candidatus Micrarchaeota archaeon CG1_02_47_40]|nr:MAG: hypothetical protein AUJ17_01345 [Candidatus Micrarchaeota archaeon CG1_02_47_40]